MKVAILSPFYPYRGGIAQFGASLFRELEKRDHEVRAYTFTRQYPGFLFPGVTQWVTPEDQADPIPAQQVLDSINPLSYRRAGIHIARFAPDLLLINFWMPFFAPALGSVAARVGKTGTCVLAVMHNVIPHERRPGDRLLMRYFLRRCHGFVVMSRAVAKDLTELRSDAAYIVQPHPVYAHFGRRMSRQESRRKLGLPENRPILLFFGFIRAYKGLDIALEALHRLPQEYLLIVAGEMYDRESKYREIIDRHQLHHRLKMWTHYIPDDQVRLLFSAADVAVVPYRSATQSGIIQIAYHFRLPVIVSNVGGLSEMIEHGSTGLILTELTAQALAQAVQFYFEHNLRDAFSANMEKQAGQYSWSAFVQAIESFYQQLTSG